MHSCDYKRLAASVGVLTEKLQNPGALVKLFLSLVCTGEQKTPQPVQPATAYLTHYNILHRPAIQNFSSLSCRLNCVNESVSELLYCWYTIVMENILATAADEVSYGEHLDDSSSCNFKYKNSSYYACHDTKDDK